MVNLPVGGSVTYTVSATVVVLGRRHADQHGNRDGCSRHDGPELRQQLGHRRRHADPAVRSLHHQDRRRRGRGARHAGDVHGRRRQQRSVRRGRRIGGRHASREPVERRRGHASRSAEAARPAAPATSTPRSTSLSGGTATFTVTADVAASATGTLSNTATVTAPPAATDPNPANNSATDVDALSPAGEPVGHQDRQRPLRPARRHGDLSRSWCRTPARPRSSNAPFSDAVPASLTGVSWTCSASAGSSCPAGGSGNSINTTVSLLPGWHGDLHRHRHRGRHRPPGIIVNTATINAPVGVVETSLGRQHGDRHHIGDADSRSRHHQDRRSDLDRRRRERHLHHRRHQRRTVDDHQRRRHRCAARGTDRRHVDVHGVGRLELRRPPAARATSSENVTLASGGTATFTVTGTVAASTPAGTLIEHRHAWRCRAVRSTRPRPTTRPPTPPPSCCAPTSRCTRPTARPRRHPVRPIQYTIVVVQQRSVQRHRRAP